MKLAIVVGTRPNFIKAAPLLHAIATVNRERPGTIKPVLIHTGQHYDLDMSDGFFAALNLPPPDHHLQIGGGSHAELTGRTMIALEAVFLSENPDWVVVVGDVNATLSATLAAKKLQLRVAHVEAGLRSGDWSMPEEINRLLVDRIADLLLVPTSHAAENLRAEGTEAERIELVGNIMIDTLDEQQRAAAALDPQTVVTAHRRDSASVFQLPKRYAVVTLHRPSNVDGLDQLVRLCALLGRLADQLPLLFALHPRTLARLVTTHLLRALETHPNIVLLRPLGYLEMLCLNRSASAIITDSGGLQEEAMVLGVPCLTLRTTTERPETLREHGGTNVLLGNNLDRVEGELATALAGGAKPHRPPFWDGHTGDRIVASLLARRHQPPFRTQTEPASPR